MKVSATVLQYPIFDCETIKSIAKKVQKFDKFKHLHEAQKALSLHLGFSDWHHLLTTISKDNVMILAPGQFSTFTTVISLSLKTKDHVYLRNGTYLDIVSSFADGTSIGETLDDLLYNFDEKANTKRVGNDKGQLDVTKVIRKTTLKESKKELYLYYNLYNRDGWVMDMGDVNFEKIEKRQFQIWGCFRSKDDGDTVILDRKLTEIEQKSMAMPKNEVNIYTAQILTEIFERQSIEDAWRKR